MELTTTIRVYNRLNEPASAGSNIGRVLEPGQLLNVAEVVKGQSISGNDNWLKLTDGSFVWAGGTDYAGNYPWWISADNIPGIWTRTTGAGVRIGLLDTGVFPDHPAFRNRVIKTSYNAKWPRVPDETPLDVSGHGTKCAGMIIGKEAAVNNNCCGIAPDSELYSYKVQSQRMLDRPEFIVQGFKAAIADDVHIISISRNVLLTPEVNEQLEEAVKNKIIVVVCSGSLGDANELMKATSVISVSAIAQDGTDLLPGGGSANPVDRPTCFAPGIGIRTTTTDGGYTANPISGTSFATPFIAGALALRIQQHGINDRLYYDVIMNEFKSALQPNNYNLPVLNLSQFIA